MPTIDLSEFGYRELDLAKDLLDALINSGVPSDFDDEGLQIAFNPNSGDVFLMNEEYDVCMEADGKLCSWYSLPYSGIEGFAWDLFDMFKDGDITDNEDLEYLVDVFTYSDDAEERWADEVREAME